MQTRRTKNSAGNSIILSSWTYQNLLINGSGSFNATGGLLVYGALNATAGTLTTTASNYQIAAAGDVILNGGTLTLNTSSVTFGGNWTQNA